MGKMAFIAAAAMLCACGPASYGQDTVGMDDVTGRAFMVLTGAMTAEEAGEEDLERLEALRSRPLKINLASRSRLAGSGLFTQYQIESIIDYRNRNGDILSAAEFAAVDGFTPETAVYYLPFLSFASSAMPGKASLSPPRMDNSLVVKSAVKLQERQPVYSYGMKYRFSVEDRFEAALTARSSYDAGKFPPEAVSFYAAYYGRGVLGKVVIGDFNLRFGQGLVMWSGFSMSGIPAQGAFSRRASGISPYWSYSGDGSHRGVAADFGTGDFMVSAFVSVPGAREMSEPGNDAAISVLPGINVSWYGMDGQVSITCYAQSRTIAAREDGGRVGPANGTGRFFGECKVSADARYTVKGVELFGEAAMDAIARSAAALAGCRFSPCGGLYLASGLRYYPSGYSGGYSGALRSGSRCSNEYGFAVSGSFSSGKYVPLAGRTGFGSSVIRHQGAFSMDMSHSPEPKFGVHEASSQFKAVFSYSLLLSSLFSMQWKVSERLRSYGDRVRTDVRADVRYGDSRWSSVLRVNILHCRGTGMLSYMEGGYKSAPVYVYVRGGLFRVDDWADRIYAYERDAPGNFSVPAYYGRGFWLSLVSGLKLSGWGRLYFRASYTGYPWSSPGQEKKKPGRAELKIQMSFNL